MQMDLWVVAAATGAGYLAKYWKNVIGDKEDSSGIPSGSSFPDNTAPLINQQTRPSHISSQIDSADQYFSEAGKGDHSNEIFRRDDPFAIDMASSSAIDHEKRVEKCEECWNVSRLGADIPDLPEYSSWEMGFSHSFGSRKCLRTRCLQRLPLQYIKPRSSLDSCLLAQMQREYAEMEDHIRTPLHSPCTPALRPFVITDGSRVISRASGDFRNELYKEVQPRSDDEVVEVPNLPQIITTKNSKQKLNRGKTRMGTSINAMKSSQFDKSDGSLIQVLFCLGISIGVMASLLSNKVEVEKLKDRLKQSENLVEDLQEELEMKDSLTVRELVNDDDSQDIHELSFTHEKMSSFSNQVDMGVPIRYANEESASLEKIESMSKIEAELEAELERLELSMKGSALKGRKLDAFESRALKPLKSRNTISMAATLLRGGRSKHHLTIIRHFSSSSAINPSHHKDHSQNHVYLEPTPIIGSWQPPKDPKEAEAKLASLRRDYAKQVKELRKQYIHEMELQKQEKMRKDEARMVEMLRQREERNRSKAVAAQARAAERKIFEQEFRETLMKEKREKLEHWRMREKAIEERKNAEKENLLRQSSMWIDEKDLEVNIMQNMVDSWKL